MFKNILSSDFKLNTKNFFIRATSSSGNARAAVTVSKKVSKSAVTRNKIRRRVYSALRGQMTKLSPNMYLIVAKPGSEKIKGHELILELLALNKVPKIVSKVKKS